jgi:hypothetical protein
MLIIAILEDMRERLIPNVYTFNNYLPIYYFLHFRPNERLP